MANNKQEQQPTIPTFTTKKKAEKTGTLNQEDRNNEIGRQKKENNPIENNKTTTNNKFNPNNRPIQQPNNTQEEQQATTHTFVTQKKEQKTGRSSQEERTQEERIQKTENGPGEDTKPTANNTITQSSRMKQQPKQRAKKSTVTPITDLKTFLAKKKLERDKRFGLGINETTQIVQLCPSNIYKREDESTRQLDKPDALETAAEHKF